MFYCCFSSSKIFSDTAVVPKEIQKHRKTGLNFNIGNEILNTKKLKHLAQMHAVLEFFLLIKDHAKFPTKCYQYIGECAYKKYVGENSPIPDFSTLQKSKLCDLTLSMDCIDESVIEELVLLILLFLVYVMWFYFSKTPVKFHMKMTSKQNHSEVTTIFLHSESPIFPPVVFNNYGNLNIILYFDCFLIFLFVDLSLINAEEKLLYVTELVQYRQFYE